jgi:hypothetical protein
MKNDATNAPIYLSGSVNQYEITKLNRYGYGNVFDAQYEQKVPAVGLAAPTGRFGCLVLGTRPGKGTIEATYCNIYESVNKWANAGFPYLPFSENFEYGDVAAVFNLYIQAVREGNCPEWYPIGNPPQNKAKVSSDEAVTYLTQRLQKNLGKYTDPAAVIRSFFYIAGDLYKQDMANGTGYINPTVLWPKTYDDTTYNAKVSEYYKKQQEEADKSIFSGANDFLSNILTFVVIGGAVYFLAPIIFSKR